MTIADDASALGVYADMTMNDRFTKVYESILDSSIWFEDSDTRCVWLTLMALADMDGMVSNTIPGLARRAFPKPPLEEAILLTVTALDLFMAPDEYSRTETEEGRRLRKVDGGWTLINYGAYRDRRRADTRREQNKEAQQRKRDRKKASARVSTRGKSKQESAQEEEEEEGEEEIPQTPTGADVDSKPKDPLLHFAYAWRELTGRSEFKEFVNCGMVGGSEQQWLRSVSKTCGGSVAEFRARVSARLAEDSKGFLLKQTLIHWERGPLQAPAVAPKPARPAAAYHAPLEPRDNDGPPVSYAEAMASQEGQT